MNKEPDWARGFRFLCEMDGFKHEHLTTADIERIMAAPSYDVKDGAVVAPTAH